MSREMRHSGVQWIGDIPKEWKVIPFKQMYNLGKGLSITKADLVDNGVPVISYGQIHSKSNNGTTIKDELIRYVPDSFLEDNTSSLVKVGDVIFADTSEDLEGCGNCVYIDRDITIFAGYHTIIARNLSDSPNNYYSYLFKTDCWRSQIRSNVNGVKLFSVPQRLLGSTSIILPPHSEQIKIAYYLDKVCKDVDEMIALQEQMIEELKAYKQSVITEAVTKGLNTDVPMKDSGIEWIGEVPVHWTISKTLYALSMPITDGPHTTPELFDDGIPFISADAVSDGYINFDNKRGYVSESFYEECCKKYIPQLNDIYMIKSGASTGKTAIVETNIIFTIWSPLAVFRVNPKVMNPYFLLYFLRSEGYQKQVENNWSFGTQQNIGMRVLERLILCYPSVTEQEHIANYLNTKCSEIGSLIEIKQAKIEELKEYKKSIIYEYVTGKKEVV